MSDTRTLLNRITAFRERLERVPHLGPASDPTDADPGLIPARAEALAADPAWLSQTLRKLAGPVNEGPAPRLTVRARTLLEDARGMIADQRKLSDDPLLAAPAKAGEPDPVAAYHRSTVALTEAALRLVQAFPDSAEVQLKMCDGVDAMLRSVRDRLGVAGRAVAARRNELGRVEHLARLLAGLADGNGVPLSAFAELAEHVLDDARRAVPVRFLFIDPYETRGPEGGPDLPAPARFVAARSLTTAQVVARVAPQDYEWASRPLLPVVAALIMDVGMLRIPPAILAKSGPLTAEERRVVERHPAVGAQLVRKVIPEANPLADAIAAHHERPDGTGYPDGLRDGAVPSLARLLAVCDVYAAMASDRPHRPAHDPRTALTETLIAAEQGRLDRDFSEHLLAMSFHPVGTVVELTDGRTAVVVANHTSRVNLRATARPVVAVLTDAAGTPLPRPDFVDLAAAERGGIARALSTAERQTALAGHYPELCG